MAERVSVVRRYLLESRTVLLFAILCSERRRQIATRGFLSKADRNSSSEEKCRPCFPTATVSVHDLYLSLMLDRHCLRRFPHREQWERVVGPTSVHLSSWGLGRTSSDRLPAVSTRQKVELRACLWCRVAIIHEFARGLTVECMLRVRVGVRSISPQHDLFSSYRPESYLVDASQSRGYFDVVSMLAMVFAGQYDGFPSRIALIREAEHKRAGVM